jgi:hypothetical protein
VVRVVVATTDDAKSIHVQIQGDKSGSSDAMYASYQLYEQDYNPYHVDKKYVFESPLTKDETFFKVTVNDKQYALHKTVQLSNGLCFGTIDHLSINNADTALGLPLYDGYEVLDPSAHMTMSGDNKMEGMNPSQNMQHDQMTPDSNGLMTMNNHDNGMQEMNNMPSMNSKDHSIMDMSKPANNMAGMSDEQTVLFTVDENTSLPVRYMLQGTISSMNVNQESKSLILHLSGTSGGEFVVELPKKLVDDNTGKLVVRASTNKLVNSGPDGETYESQSMMLNYDLLDSSPDVYTLKMELPSDVNTITVVGTSVVPEFEQMAMMMLILSIFGMLTVSRIKRI